MEDYLKHFDEIWLSYCNIISIQSCELDVYMKIIHKIRQGEISFSEDKTVFTDLIEIVSETIYAYKYGESPYDEHYEKDNAYENDDELNCCYKLKNYLKYMV